jgi:hypothetical protein
MAVIGITGSTDGIGRASATHQDERAPSGSPGRPFRVWHAFLWNASQ